MVVQQLNITRGASETDSTIGITPDNKSRLFNTDTVLDEFGQKIRRFPKRLTIEFDIEEGNGEMVRIESNWLAAQEGNNGKIIPKTRTSWDPILNRKLDMLTNETDRAAFTLMLGNPILKSMLNGFFRAIMGYNGQPPFDAAGNPTNLNTSDAPSFDYDGQPTAPPTNP